MSENNEKITTEETPETVEAAEELNKMVDEEQPEENHDDEDDALQSFLSREQKDKKTVKNSKINKRVMFLIIAAVVVAVLVFLLVFLRNHTPVGSTADDALLAPAEFSVTVNDKGEHEAQVTVDENGKIVKNGSGVLLEYDPADIKLIEVENENGSFTVSSNTPAGEATVYTLEGFDGVTLQPGIADEVATACSNVEFIEVISPDGNLSDFGLDKPRAVAQITYQDDTTAKLRIGSEAAAGAGTYVAFGSSNAVYLLPNDKVAPLFYKVNEFISLEITTGSEDSDSTAFSRLTISGSHYPEKITLVPNTDEAIDVTYLVTEPRSMFANPIESYDISGSVRGLYADEVVCVHPSGGQKSDYGVANPYATVTAVYPDTTITLSASAPLDDGSVYLYNPDKDIIYSIQKGAVSWVSTDVDALVHEQILPAKIDAVSKLEFAGGGKSYTFDVSTTTELTDDEEGETQEVTTTVAKYNGKELSSDNFSIFYQNLTGIRNAGMIDGSGKEVMRCTLTYSTGRASDTIVIYESGTAQYIAELNGKTVGSASKSYIDSLIADAAAIVKGENITSL